jgi:enoyl-CoA hydratase/carnithine racemase
VLTGREISAAQALEWGLIADVVAASRLRRSAMRLARDMSRLMPDLVRRLKQAVHEGMDASLDEGLRLEARLALA